MILRLLAALSALLFTAGLALAQQAVIVSPTGGAGSGITPVASAAASGGEVIKATPGNLYGVNVASGASAGFVMLIDAVAVPADGAVAPKKCWHVAANATIDHKWVVPIRFNAGIVVVFSTTGCYSKTASATAFISGDAR